MTLLAEFDRIIDLLEMTLPVSMAKDENKKLTANLRRSMAQYFSGLEKAFPYYMLTKVYDLHVKEAAPTVPGIDFDWLDPLLNSFRADLLYRLNSHVAGVYIAGANQMMTYGKTKMGIPIAYEGPPISQAIEWAEQHCAQLVTQIDEETKSQLAKIISDGIENKRGIEGISRDIRAQFTDMAKTRADMIAQTETNTALSQAAMDKMHDMGIDGKEWITIGDERQCDICRGNEDAGVLAIDDMFPSGDAQPPAHPNCRCGISPARLNRED